MNLKSQGETAASFANIFVFGGLRQRLSKPLKRSERERAHWERQERYSITQVIIFLRIHQISQTIVTDLMSFSASQHPKILLRYLRSSPFNHSPLPASPPPLACMIIISCCLLGTLGDLTSQTCRQEAEKPRARNAAFQLHPAVPSRLVVRSSGPG